MAIVIVPPTQLDIAVAKTIAAHTGPRIERTAQLLTWGADEHILCALAAGWWLFCRSKGAAKRHASDHILVTTLVASALPHILKAVFDQERPDRTTIRGHWRGIPFSGNRLDAFPSGHAVHIGAVASAASVLPPMLLAHWFSDVAAGLVLGGVTERLIRQLTGYGRSGKPPN